MTLSPINSASGSGLSALAVAGNPKAISHLPPAQQTKAVAGQFEAILLRQFLQDSVGNLMGGKSAGASGSVYGYMLTDVLASKLSDAGGLGLAKILERQLTPRPAKPPGAAPTPTP